VPVDGGVPELTGLQAVAELVPRDRDDDGGPFPTMIRELAVAEAEPGERDERVGAGLAGGAVVFWAGLGQQRGERGGQGSG
jgi:hypothetical protein